MDKMNLDEFLRLSREYRYVPLWTSFHADEDTPITLYRKLVGDGLGYLLESVERGTVLGRYSFVGAEPMAFFTWPLDPSKEGAPGGAGREPLAELQRWLDGLQVAPIPESARLPRFYGGAVGYYSYDLIRYYERLPEYSIDDRRLPEMVQMVTRCTLIIDHLRHQGTLVYLAESGDEAAYQYGQSQMAKLLEKLRRPVELPASVGTESKVDSGKVKPMSTFDLPSFCQAVERCKEYIAAGDAFQIVLSQRFSMPLKTDPLNVYRSLRSLNPSPYLFYLNLPGMQMAGSSPEALIRVEGRRVETHPIAGTRPRGKDAEEDQRLAEELLQDEKERAEHLMLVDLGRNDLGRVCEIGSVRVERFMEVEHYSHVMHIVSRVAGELKASASALESLARVMPAGTLSGAPKIRAMEIIDELEPVRRGPYGGAVGYLSFDGNLDTCITIRTVLMRDGKAEIQVGAGIVADSVPEMEYQETVNKAKALFEALAEAEERFR
ncbi:anthranilate synthase component I [Heliobacterium chlorum]|uniref:Anthranilate synthase component 1 n=1 Tax=Heliobacterium chlorum TaxID=2698 RepID=A0ABR7SYM1_HELCL|nr:anthranilate synthase component I [Heliobacterium chlorum]MBC9783120.1 anthranilate synthase component I [Heliobacterium chlorum]